MIMMTVTLRRLQHLDQILLVAGTLLIVAVVTVVTSAIFWLHDRTLRDAETRLSQLTLVFAEQVERALESVDGVTQVAVSRISRSRLSDAEMLASIQTYLSQQSFNLPQARSFLVLDENGDRIVDSQYATPLPQNNSDSEGFRHFRSNPHDSTAYLSTPTKSRQTGEWFFSLSRGMETSEGGFGGIITATIDLGYFAKVFESLTLGDSASIGFTRTDGINLFRYPFSEAAMGRSFADSPIHRQHLHHANAGVVRQVGNATGEDRILSFRRLNGYPVVIIVADSVHELLAPWRIQAWALALFGLVAVGGLSAAGMVLLRLARREEALLAEAQEARNAADLATKAAERASRAKSEFLAGVSHDLRTPLNSIIGFSQVMQGGIGGALPKKCEEYVDFIHTSGKHLLSLINNLLDLAKIEANRLTILDDQFSLHSVVGECLRLVASQADAGRVTLVPYAERDLGLKADPVRVRQILFNLLSNAIKFTLPGGTVEMRGECTEDGSLRLSIVDTGVGMSTAELATAMQPYGQVINSYTRQHEGTGLGLPLVSALVDLHGGRFEMESVPKKGTTATVIFPPERVLRPDGPEIRAA